MKKNVTIISIVLVIIISIVLLKIFNSNEKINKIYLDDKYYSEGKVTDITSEKIDNLKDESYLLFTYNSYCGMTKPCEKIFYAVLKKYNIDFYSVPIAEFRKTKYHDTVKYAPSFMVISKGELIAYLDAEDDSQLKYYQEENDFEEWLGKYIYFNK